MSFIKLLPAILSLLLLGAHFLRSRLWVLVLLAVIMLAFLLIRRQWSARLVQIFLVIGGLEWVRTLIILADMRKAEGMPWMRLAIILGGVAAFTICSALVFRFKSLRERYKLT